MDSQISLPLQEHLAGPVRVFLEALKAQGFIAAEIKYSHGWRDLSVEVQLTKSEGLGDLKFRNTAITLKVEEQSSGWV